MLDLVGAAAPDGPIQEADEEVAQIGGAANRRNRVERAVEQISAHGRRAWHGRAAERQRDQVEGSIAHGAKVRVHHRRQAATLGEKIAEVQIPVHDVTPPEISGINVSAERLDALDQGRSPRIVGTK